MIEQTLSALADPTRRGVVELLRDQPRRAGELAQALSASPPAMSRHLKVLRQAGLVEPLLVEEDARGRMYRLRIEPLAELRAWVQEVEGFWTAQLGAFANHLDGREEA
ncbi:metalloregulator ArsR/SmtB family transcription factor [Myxococcota bacterium]|nr:metalloregulator ArsR/SmtB family transcription factor [Myxococcota bacterium]